MRSRTNRSDRRLSWNLWLKTVSFPFCDAGSAWVEGQNPDRLECDFPILEIRTGPMQNTQQRLRPPSTLSTYGLVAACCAASGTLLYSFLRCPGRASSGNAAIYAAAHRT